MVKVGFIVEGASESIIISSPNFKAFLYAHGYELVTPVVDAEGGGNLLPKYIESFIDRLQKAGAEKICILTDLEEANSPNEVRTRIAHDDIDICFIAVKALEAWFLADTEAMKIWLNEDAFFEEHPEATQGMPWERLRELGRQPGKRGPANKVSFAKKMVNYYGFKVDNAAQHPNCHSVRELTEYFEADNAN
ncbi:hypothetical protein [Xenorhabdus doucetiae]|uniref:DUF4276 family protein n=1 Tax=Xenorhabdus doucetiae TaxID=351671 RepID=A0A068QMP0_9GAMM|nr:hypothetical protein [Xenorhabdus doucetiae]TYP01949.1 hypothetical protein LY16_02626 [Xenorhabdus doucetiae]CDG15736.1 conserved protein of unknown function [Xenorhabdus doucetiae]